MNYRISVVRDSGHNLFYMKKFDELEKSYKEGQTLKKTAIRLEVNKFKRFWKWVWFYATYPFLWVWVNIRDIRTFIIFIIVFLVVSIEVWLPYLLGLIFWNNEPFRLTMFGVASACWLFWLGPFTPFLPLCIVITIGIKGLFNKHSEKKENKRKELEGAKQCPYYIDEKYDPLNNPEYIDREL